MKGSSIREIARAADVSLATIHHYFGSKEGLADACVDEMQAKFKALRVELVQELISSGGYGPSLFEQGARTAFRLAREHREAVRFLLQLAVSGDPVLARRRDEVVGPALSEGSRALSLVTGRPETEFRLPLQSVIFLLARYSSASIDELKMATGAEDEATALRLVEDHIAGVGVSFFGAKRE